MAGSPDGQGLPDRAVAAHVGTAPVHLPSAFAETQTVVGSQPGESAQQKASAAWPAGAARPVEIVRHGPGVPVTVPGSPG